MCLFIKCSVLNDLTSLHKLVVKENVCIYLTVVAEISGDVCVCVCVCILFATDMLVVCCEIYKPPLPFF